MNYNKIELSYIVPVYIENENCKALNNLIETYESYDVEIRKKTFFVFVDDHSPVKISIKTDKLNYILLRIKDNIQWNQGGARNLGVLYAKSPKLILTDLDHHFSEELFRFLLRKKIPKVIYSFRSKMNGKKVSSHPNIFFCTKSLFYKSLGVDEEFCGNYGYEDIYFKELQKALGTKFRKIRRYSNEKLEHKEDKNITHHYLDRDTKVNEKLLETKMAFLETKNPLQGHSRKSLLFDWEVIDEKISVE